MASKRAIRRKACVHKFRYSTHLDAVQGISRLRRRTRTSGLLLAYACKFCGGFHFGHAPLKIRRALRNSA